jgi:hypothetical protein
MLPHRPQCKMSRVVSRHPSLQHDVPEHAGELPHMQIPDTQVSPVAQGAGQATSVVQVPLMHV